VHIDIFTPMNKTYPPTNSDVRASIAEYLITHGKTIHALSLSAGVSQSTLREFMAERQGMSLETLEKIAPTIYAKTGQSDADS